MNYDALGAVRIGEPNPVTYHYVGGKEIRAYKVISATTFPFDISRKEVRTAEDYHNQPNREEQGCDSSDETWRICLVPGCCLRGQHYCATVAAFSISISCTRTRPLQVTTGARCKRSPEFLTHPKPNKGPAMKELKKSLSNLICVFLHPILETNSMVCWGVKASMACYSKEEYRVGKRD